MAIYSFRDRATEDILHAQVSKDSLRRLPVHLHAKAVVKLARLAAAESLEELGDLPGNRLEPLAGKRKGQHSIRINDQYRICFVWIGDGAELVEIVDYH